jgi:hypothetical protein
MSGADNEAAGAIESLSKLISQTGLPVPGGSAEAKFDKLQ